MEVTEDIIMEAMGLDIEEIISTGIGSFLIRLWKNSWIWERNGIDW